MSTTQPTNQELYLQSLHELTCARLGNSSKVVDEISFGHADARVPDGESVVVLVGNDGDLHLLLRIQYRGISQTLVPDLVQCLVNKRTTVQESTYKH